MPAETGCLEADRRASFSAASIFALALISAMVFPGLANAESPGVTTEAASEVTSSAATLRGKVNPHGFATTYRFEYGTTTSYGTSVPVPDKSAGSGTSPVEVSEEISVAMGSTYHFRVVATSAEGTSFGKDETFEVEADPRFSFSFGSEGVGNGELYIPTDIAIDSEGSIWILDTGNNRVQKFNSEGEYLSKFGSTGIGNGQFNFPQGIAIDSKGNIWVADSENNRVQKFNSEGKYLSKFGTVGSENGQLDYPEGIAIDSESNLWVVDTGNNRVQKFNSEGKYLSKFGAAGSEAGQLLVPGRITIDYEGDLWVADTGNSRVQKFDSKGEYLSKFGPMGSGDGELTSPRDITIDSGGKLWVADAGNNRVQGFSPESAYLSKFGTWGEGIGQFLYPEGIATDSKGNIWVVEPFNCRVQKWIPSRPVVTTKAASGVAKEAATLNGTVNPNGQETIYRFEYGTTTSYGTNVPVPDKNAGSGTSGVEVSEGISGLKASTTYHFRVVATNAEGTSFGKDETLTTK